MGLHVCMRACLCGAMYVCIFVSEAMGWWAHLLSSNTSDRGPAILEIIGWIYIHSKTCIVVFLFLHTNNTLSNYYTPVDIYCEVYGISLCIIVIIGDDGCRLEVECLCGDLVTVNSPYNTL